MTEQEILSVIFQASVFIFWGWVIFRLYISSEPRPAIISMPLRVFRILLIIATFGVLGGCTNPDPLAVAAGPIFALNAGHWQPSPQDLAAVPVVAKQ
jgi:hypothetical protein